MRLLFISSTTTGGSGRSQRDLARRLIGLGHEVVILADDHRRAPITRRLYGHLSDLAARLEGGRWGQIAAWTESRPGRRARELQLDGLTVRTSPVPQNAALRLLADFGPDLVVGNSLERLAWRRIHRACERHRVPTILYVREISSLDHLARGEYPDALVANARSLQSSLQGRGYECEFVPSVTELDATATVSSREVALLVNPTESHGIDLLWKLAALLPEVHFVVQHSRPPTDAETECVAALAAGHPNVECRPLRPPGPALYGDARLLLVPHRIDNRPRVILEAQANGIPVIASRTDGLIEAVGPGGLTLDMDDVQGWRDAVADLMRNTDRYEVLSRLALAHSQRDEVNPETAARNFEAIARQLVEARRVRS